LLQSLSISNHIQLLCSDQLRDEVVAGRALFLELAGSPDLRVDGAAETFLGRIELGGQIEVSHRSDDAEVDVAQRSLSCARDRAEHERRRDLRGFRPQCVSKHVYEADRLRDDAVQLGEVGATPIGLIVDAVAVLPAPQDAGAQEAGQCSLQARRSAIDEARKVAQVPPAIGLHQGRGEHGLHASSQQRIERSRFTHNA
jgi:hypothetical protein